MQHTETQTEISFEVLKKLYNKIHKEILLSEFELNKTEIESTKESLFEFRSIRHNFTYKTPSKILISVDWLEVFGECNESDLYRESDTEIDTFKTEAKILSNGLAYLYTGKSTQRFSKLFEVYDGGQKIGMLQIQPKVLLDNMTKASASFKLCNNLLYTENWSVYFLEILQKMNFTMNNVTRLDIAIDGCNQLADFLNVYFKEDVANNYHQIDWLGKTKPDGRYMDKTTRKYKTFYIGKRNSMKHICVYHKSEEIENNTKKEYIKDFWEKNGLHKDNVIRCEMRFDSRYIKTITGFMFENLLDNEYLAKLFKTGCDKFFHFREINPNDSNKTRWREINTIPYHLLSQKVERLERHELPITDKLYGTKLSIKNMVLQLLALNLNHKLKAMHFEVLKEIITKNKLVRWFQKHVDKWITENRVYESNGHCYTMLDNNLLDQIEDDELSEMESISIIDQLFKDLNKNKTYQQTVNEELGEFENQMLREENINELENAPTFI